MSATLLALPLAMRAAAPMPPNPERVAAELAKRGIISPNASAAEKEKAVAGYLQQKLGERGRKPAHNPPARKRLTSREAALEAETAKISGRALGRSASVAPSSPQFQGLAGSSKALLLLVEFADTPFAWTPAGGQPRTAQGPLHNKLPVPNNSYDLWIADFNQQHYESMLFGQGGWTFPAATPRYAGQKRPTMRDYYLEQSYGKYSVTGKAYGWFQVGRPEAYYGDDDPAGGTDNLAPGTMSNLIQDVVAVANASNAVPWAEYDLNNDCIIDHTLLAHAGADQSAGGGAQGDDAIWAHSSAVPVRVADPHPGCPVGSSGIFIYNYTIMPEDGGIGVFAHEFGHDLGLPDEYDTIYSGRGESIASWSIMSGGSWNGLPAQTQPTMMSAWARLALGWLVPGGNLGVTDLGQLSAGVRQARLEQASRWGGPGTLNAVRVNLPAQVIVVNAPHSGAYEWFGGKADLIDTTLTRSVDLTGKTSASLTFWTWYDIEEGWDFGFVQVSQDGGATWTSLDLTGMTRTHDPNAMSEIVANLPGFTGASGGWVMKTADLSAHAGRQIQLRFRYMTDWGTTGAGFYVDDIAVTADGAVLFSDQEANPAGWVAAGWTRDTGRRSVPHYYLLEWRNSRAFATPHGAESLVNADEGLNFDVQFDPYSANPYEPRQVLYAPGLVLWYRNFLYTDNWVGVHPGYGYLLVVDAHKQARLRPPYPGIGILPWNTHVQSYDAAFSLDRAEDLMLSYFGVQQTDPALGAVPNFDDSLSYWSVVAPHASAKTRRYGFTFRVQGQAPDGSAALVGLGAR
jgi:immune inhibitor A